MSGSSLFFRSTCCLGIVAACRSLGAPDVGEDSPAPVAPAMWSPRLPARHAGFVEIPERRLRVSGVEPDDSLLAGAARLSYRFAPAQRADAPLCVISSGGPGITSAMMQRSFGVTASESGLLAPVCHALFIDQRNTGFSYNLGRDVQPSGSARFSLGDNNPYTDAADFVWATLDLVARYPDLFELPIVVLGESYGGVRATLMVDLWLHPEAYERGERRVVDDDLVALLRELETELGGEFRARVRHQVLIQPTLAGTEQDEASGRRFDEAGSVIDEIAAELGTSYTRCDFDGCLPYFHALNAVEAWGRSIYKYPEPAGWLERRLAEASSLFETSHGAVELLAFDPLEIPLLHASARQDAWRLASPDSGPDSAWASETLGDLHDDDRYFVPFNDPVFSAFSSAAAEDLGIDWLDPSYADHFLRNCRSVDTLLTRATFDLVNYSPGLLDALAQHPTLSHLELDESAAGERPGTLAFAYQDGTHVRVRSPLYVAGHGIVSDQGRQLTSDILAWLSD